MTQHDATKLPARERTVRALLDADTLTDLSIDVPRELLAAARAEVEVPADETDEG